MAVTQTITLDVNRVDMFDCITTKQADSGRKIKIKITVDGVQYEIPSGATITLRVIKPDGTSVLKTGSVTSDGCALVQLNSNILAAPGRIHADVAVLDGDTTVSTVSFVIRNQKLPGDTSAITSSNSYEALSTLTNSINNTYNSLAASKANGTGITVSFDNGDLLVKEVS